MKKIPAVTLVLALAAGGAIAASSSTDVGQGGNTATSGRASMHQLGSELRGALHKLGEATRHALRRAGAAVHRDRNGTRDRTT